MFKAAETKDTPAQAKWKASGFINLYLTDREGNRRKLGAIPLKDGNPRHKALRAWLEEDPTRVNKVIEALEADYQPATTADAPDFDVIQDTGE